MKWPDHGGQPEQLKQLFNIDDDEMKTIDLSANLNPLGPPAWLKEKLSDLYETISRYPDPTYSSSKASLAAFEGIPEDNLLLTNGGAEAIFLAAKYFEHGQALIVHPTFLEYERACNHYHVKTEDVYYDQETGFQLPLRLIEEKLNHTDVLFLCRPNNPSGTVVKEDDIRSLLEAGKQTETFIVVDEAFVDFLPSTYPSLSTLLPAYPNLIVLRSLTKMYTIPGLRVGYMMADKDIIASLQAEQLPWSINALAHELVPSLVEDTDFVRHTTSWLNEQWQNISQTLASLDFYVSPSEVNFYLLQDQRQPTRTEELFQFLLQHGIVTRHTHNFKGLNGKFLRVAIKAQPENEHLLAILRKWRNES
ncbi:threonine-phosphate decarboxylase CobD [Salsuginibacillus kocurii]|uniref:threonine-phosphate decarboxylase CobD n=1 Tax=Salsuginibacillus kocurii TaxID=427078 RepID=UPI000377E20B|nr:threonine-phosphate decarboxylase CobD [Salsuginibacillus kocurii]